jgi:hypothetical protein
MTTMLDEHAANVILVLVLIAACAAGLWVLYQLVGGV